MLASSYFQILIKNIYYHYKTQTFAIGISVHHKPQLIWEACAHSGAVPISVVLLFFSRVVIERPLSNMSLRSLRIAVVNIQNFCEGRATIVSEFGKISKTTKELFCFLLLSEYYFIKKYYIT